MAAELRACDRSWKRLFIMGVLNSSRTRALAWALTLMAALCVGTGCKSVSPSRYVAPRVTGRVLEMDSHQPIKDVKVRRVSAEDNARPMDAPHGGGVLEQASAVRTAADGTFVLKSMRTLSVLDQSGWYSVTLAFERAGYESVMRTYTLVNSTNTPSGEPLVQTGDVLLPRLNSR
jgi:hypothetical protein